ncbi:MAG TPA: hypothetical protein VFA45_01565 [Actinomycetes bacterium]|nr:hypothetical protein [Actinomycetes bacterium]
MNAEATSVRTTERIRAVPGPWSTPPSDAPVGAATRLVLAPLRMLSTSMGRRLALATVLSLALLAVVSSLYDHADGAAATSAPASSLRATPAAAARPAPATARPAAAPAAQRAAARPEEAATAWYARHKRVAADRVHALQQERISATVTRVLVMAEVSATDMPTAFVTVRRDGTGWKVP